MHLLLWTPQPKMLYMCIHTIWWFSWNLSTKDCAFVVCAKRCCFIHVEWTIQRLGKENGDTSGLESLHGQNRSCWSPIISKNLQHTSTVFTPAVPSAFFIERFYCMIQHVKWLNCFCMSIYQPGNDYPNRRLVSMTCCTSFLPQHVPFSRRVRVHRMTWSLADIATDIGCGYLWWLDRRRKNVCQLLWLT